MNAFDQTLITMLSGGAILGIIGWLWRHLTTSLADLRKEAVSSAKELADYKLHVAETYTSKVDMSAFDLKITAHLIRIEDKLDRVKKSPPA